MADADCTKSCTKCRQEKPVSEFGKQAGRKDGLNPWCKACKSVSGKQHYARNRDRLKPIRKAWERRNIQLRRGYLRAFMRRWRHRDPVGHRAYMARYRTPEINRAYARTDYWRNRAQRLIEHRAWRSRNPEILRSLSKRYRARNPDRIRALRWNYKARKRAAIGTHTGADVQELLKAQRKRCAYCQVNISGKFHVDHIVPLSRGGSNWPSNLQLLCARCNLSKKDKLPQEFAREIGLLS